MKKQILQRAIIFSFVVVLLLSSLCVLFWRINWAFAVLFYLLFPGFMFNIFILYGGHMHGHDKTVLEDLATGFPANVLAYFILAVLVLAAAQRIKGASH